MVRSLGDLVQLSVLFACKPAEYTDQEPCNSDKSMEI